MNTNIIARILVSLHKRQDKSDKPFSEYKSILEARESVLNRFQPAFTAESIGELSESTFRDFLDFKHNQHWTGLQRPTSHTCDDMPKLRKSLSLLVDHSSPLEARLDALLSGGDHSVNGLGIGILSAVLLVSSPQDYGVWNAKSESALKKLNVWPKFERGSTTGQRYAMLNALFRQLSQKTGLDLWAIDGLWHVLNELSDLTLDQALADEQREVELFLEGRKTELSGYRYERDRKAREKCLKKHGTECVVCGFDFFRTYGELGLGYIHVHHRTDLAIAGVTNTDPTNDLVPVCPNCHAMLHKGVSPARSIEELKKIMTDWAMECEQVGEAGSS
ncbi:HNH endonuclease [Rubinisphaera sp. JC750]|uniref:HNH endonuclease n=1 Tax=Rubinisphaera sp. JC750 TaxID=2898658 RepID=UPI001F0221C2|nr:HNH endonuclease [Rubinisphaera sp. JC750]